MGVIRKQGLSSSILIYLGFALGALNILVLFAKFLSLEQAGLIFLFVAVGKIILGFASFGNTAIMNKFFPYYSSYLPKKENDFLLASTMLPIIGIFLTSIVWLVADDLIIRKTIEKSPLFVDYYYWVIPYSAFLILYTVLETFSYTRYKSVFPTILRELGIRILTSLLIFLLVIGAINFYGLVAAYSVIYLLLVVLMLLYLHRTGDLIFIPKISKVTRRLKGKMLAYGSYIYGGLIISALAENADTFIIGSLVGLGSVTIYQTGHFIATIIQVPYRSLSAIAAPVISQAWKDKDLRLIQVIYQKTSLNQLLAALMLFGAIWVNIDFILNFLGENFDGVKEIVFILGIARILDLGFGQNAEILHNSKYWKFNFFSYVLLVLAFLPTNYFLVKEMGIQGSAWSNLLSFSLFNLVRYIFLWVKCDLQPFNWSTLSVIGIAAFAYLIANMVHVDIDVFGLANLTLRSGVFLTLFLIPLIYFKVSIDVNTLLSQSYQRFVKKK